MHCYVLVTDRGPNEVLARKCWQVVCKDSTHVLVWTSDCYEHAAHLVSLQGLKSIDVALARHGRPWKYFASLSTVSHTLRDLSRLVFANWADRHGSRSAIDHRKALFPKCVAGRWNSVSDVEARLSSIGGKKMLEPVLLASLQQKAAGTGKVKDAEANEEAAQKPQKAQKASKQGTETTPAAVDELGVEEMKAYQLKMGRWRQQTKTCVCDGLWWVVAEAMRHARMPVLHLSVLCIDLA